MAARIEVDKTEQEARIRQLEEKKTQQEARIDQLELEKTELTTNLLEKIPECPVNIKLYFTLSDKFLNALFPRFVSISSRRISRSSAASLVTTSVDPARTTGTSR